MDALESGWITSGPRVLALENLLAEQVGINHVACCNSATSGLLLLLHWYGITRGDEVIVPAYTYAATALVVMHLGAKPVMVDCGDDFNINVDQLQDKITDKTKAIIPVDIAGWPCDYKRIVEIVESKRSKFVPTTENQRKLGRIMILIDAAHSIGAVYNGEPAGRLGDFSVFSFHAVKNITTAEGGAMCINLPESEFDHEQVYRTLKLWSLNGQSKDALAKTNGAGWRYDIVYPGYKMNMPDICAAIGLAQLRKYPTYILPERKKIFEQYNLVFSKYTWAQLPPFQSANTASSYHVYALRLFGITEPMRDRMIERIAAKGVSVNVHFQPLPMLTVFRERGYAIGDFPEAYNNYSREISLPVYPGLLANQIAYVADAVAEAYNHVIQ